jgi:hypothetical protein
MQLGQLRGEGAVGVVADERVGVAVVAAGAEGGICGSEERMTPVKYSDYLAQQIGGAQEAVVPDATHFVQLQKYQQVNARIEGFLSSLK